MPKNRSTRPSRRGLWGKRRKQRRARTRRRLATCFRLSKWEIAACKEVCICYDSNVGHAPTAIEVIQEAGGPFGLHYSEEIGAYLGPANLEEGGCIWLGSGDTMLSRLVLHGYLVREPIQYIGESGRRAPECYSPTDKARKLSPERYWAPIGNAKPTREEFEASVTAWEAWRENGEHGPCPKCGQPPGTMHMTKLCAGASRSMMVGGQPGDPVVFPPEVMAGIRRNEEARAAQGSSSE
jgi:hypothetical protein